MRRPSQRWQRARRCAWLAGLALALGSTGSVAEPGCAPVPPPPSAEQLQAAQRTASDRGMLWRLSKDGRESYLFGTIHVGKLQWSFPGPALRQALARSDLLALEFDPGDPRAAELLRAASRADTPALPDTLRRRLQAQMLAACLPAQALDGLHPVLQTLSLSLLAARQDALDAAYAQELMLAAQARAAGRRIVALEGIEQQLALLLSSDAAQTQVLVEQALEQLERGRTRPLLRRLAQAWADGDLDTLEQYASWCECADSEDQRALLRRLNDERNAHLADGIEALHAQGQRVFAAVGALHMTGPQALPGLLAQRGFRVQRVAFSP